MQTTFTLIYLARCDLEKKFELEKKISAKRERDYCKTIVRQSTDHRNITATESGSSNHTFFKSKTATLSIKTAAQGPQKAWFTSVIKTPNQDHPQLPKVPDV